MAEKFLGASFEIHGGGLDLVFPHHEDEIAQSRGAGRQFARIWIHNGMLRFAGEEMHKSIGNVVSLATRSTVGSRDAARLLPHGSLAEAARLHGTNARGGGTRRAAA